MTAIDLTDLQVAIERMQSQLNQPNLPLTDLIEAEASLDYYSRAVAKLARKAQSLKLATRPQAQTAES